MTNVLWFKEIKKKDISTCGGKGASLGEMYNSGIPVPPGFVVTAQAYKHFLEETGIAEEIYFILGNLNVEDNKELQEASKKIQEIIIRAQMPKEIVEDIIESYESLNVDEEVFKKAGKEALSIIKAGREPPFVAVRSSATAEDLPSISKDEHILIKINNKTYFRRMEEIYDLVGDGTGYNIEIPAMKDNKVQWVKVGSLYKHKAKEGDNLYKIKTKTGREITVSSNHSLIILDEDTLKTKTVKSINDLKGNEKVPVINKLPALNLNQEEIDTPVLHSSVKWDQIEEIKEISYDDYVYDFCVPNVENFAAGIGGIITHNTASFAGQQSTFLNIKGNKGLIKAVQECWASLFTARAIYYRVKNNFPHEKVFIAVVIQKMINSRSSGVIFSVNPMTNDETEIVIEAGWGLGEAVVSGSITPDQFIIDKKTLRLKNKKINEQTWMYTLDPQLGYTVKKNVLKEKMNAQKLTESEIKRLTDLTLTIEEHYGSAQDIEYAIENNSTYIVQSRPVTTLKKVLKQQETTEKPAGMQVSESEVLVQGLGASPGIAFGSVKIVKGIEDLGKVLKGDVLVTRMTNPDMVPTMQRASAIVTNEGGSTCHAAIVSREMGIPCIVGTEKATFILKENDLVTVDAYAGKVYKGQVSIEKKQESYELEQTAVETVTGIKVIMDLPEFAEKAAKTGADGVGLLRNNLMLVKHGEHPSHMIKTGKKEQLIQNIVEGVSKIAEAFKGKPVWYRTFDAPTDEYRGMKGGEDEPIEANPMMGWRSIRRSLDEPELLKAEFEAIKKVHEKGLTNVGIMIPLVIYVDEIKKAKEILRESGLEPMKDIAFGIMVETPAAVQLIKEICEEGVSFISFGTNDLTQFTLALDRDNAKISKLYNEKHPAVLRQIKYVIDTCKQYNIETSICGQAGSDPEMAELLVKMGIDSISANPDAVKKIRYFVAKAEKKLLLNAARKKSEIDL